MNLMWAPVTFLIAAIPFSVMVGYVAAGVDIRNYGDKNPGATNVLRATGSKFWFFVAVNLDICKGLVPVALAYWYAGIGGLELTLIALAAVAGHAFSPFLKFNGGKAIATSGGVWMAATFFVSGIVQGFLLVYSYFSVESSDWAVVLSCFGWLLYLLLTRSDMSLLVLWAGNFLILVYKHRTGLRELPEIKRWLPFVSTGIHTQK